MENNNNPADFKQLENLIRKGYNALSDDNFYFFEDISKSLYDHKIRELVGPLRNI